ncbi:hypothetical protein GCM10018773_55120 [Streptomyces candidus]|nr:hypothetical protein GCM10018773_55120 [Streptomyces candidus]
MQVLRVVDGGVLADADSEYGAMAGRGRRWEQLVKSHIAMGNAETGRGS